MMAVRVKRNSILKSFIIKVYLSKSLSVKRINILRVFSFSLSIFPKVSLFGIKHIDNLLREQKT